MPKESIKPTEGELEILQALWKLGPATVRQVHSQLGVRTGYTTILKLMQIMTDKGLLTRIAKGRLHVYRPAQPQAKTEGHLVRDLIDRAFEGSARKLVVAALGSGRASAADLKEIRKLLQQSEGDES